MNENQVNFSFSFILFDRLAFEIGKWELFIWKNYISIGMEFFQYNIDNVCTDHWFAQCALCCTPRQVGIYGQRSVTQNIGIVCFYFFVLHSHSLKVRTKKLIVKESSEPMRTDSRCTCVFGLWIKNKSRNQMLFHCIRFFFTIELNLFTYVSLWETWETKTIHTWLKHQTWSTDSLLLSSSYILILIHLGPMQCSI